ncbi:mutator family transposase [Algoriphagus ratkowskyi]|uniref:Transposase n=4 Tax=Algoriphagus ratkowskyi TaxID=57028 RepID=A0A2W7QJQ8_9BACT|nr:transposase [Algoriphagus ratkowskyi]PZX48798.1 mutator family transposase [Algoriphagus ratkowskyi]TXD75251.1 transposase [Algoriphagus ratkowskyi]
MEVIRWGKQVGKQRFKCKNCGIFFTRNSKEQTLRNRFVWFEKWVIERQTFKILSRESGLSKDTLQRIFYEYLSRSPSVKIIKRTSVNLRMDATYFKRFCLVCYQDNEDGYTQLIRFSNGEHYEEIKEDLDNLLRLGIQLESITTDGHKSILKAIKKSLPDVIVQRCLVHIQRMCLIWLTKYPKHIAGQELRRLVLMLLQIKTSNDQLSWKRALDEWQKRYKDYLNEKTFNSETGRYWYTHKLLRRSHQTIKRAMPNMFHYLSNPKIPATTNGIEGYFSHLKNHLDIHRGLSLRHRIDFIKWYVFLSNKK